MSDLSAFMRTNGAIGIPSACYTARADQIDGWEGVSEIWGLTGPAGPVMVIVVAGASFIFSSGPMKTTAGTRPAGSLIYILRANGDVVLPDRRPS